MTLAILAARFAATSLLVLLRKGTAGVRAGLGVSAGLLRQVAPLIAMGMLFAGMVRVVLPSELITRWMGADSGFSGVLIGAALGAVMPGGPAIVMPLTGSVFSSGAGVGAVAAFLTAWSVIPLTRTIMYEVPFMGGAFAASRLAVNAPFPIIVGLLAPPVYAALT